MENHDEIQIKPNKHNEMECVLVVHQFCRSKFYWQVQRYLDILKITINLLTHSVLVANSFKPIDSFSLSLFLHLKLAWYALATSTLCRLYLWDAQCMLRDYMIRFQTELKKTFI